MRKDSLFLLFSEKSTHSILRAFGSAPEYIDIRRNFEMKKNQGIIEKSFFSRMKTIRGHAFLWGAVLSSMIFVWILYPKASPKVTPIPPRPTVSIGNADEIMAIEHEIETAPVRAVDTMPELPDILANGTFFSLDATSEASGTAMIIRDQWGKYFLRFEDFSLSPLLGLQILFANNAEGLEATFFQNLTAHRGELNMPLPNDFDPYQNPFLIIFSPNLNRIIATAELR